MGSVVESTPSSQEPTDSIRKGVSNQVLRDSVRDGTIAAAIIIVGFGLAFVASLFSGHIAGDALVLGIVFAIGACWAFIAVFLSGYALSPVELDLHAESVFLGYRGGRQKLVLWRDVHRIRLTKRKYRLGRSSVYVSFLWRKPRGILRVRSLSMLLEERVARVVIAAAPRGMEILGR